MRLLHFSPVVLMLVIAQVTGAGEPWGSGQTIVKEETYGQSQIKLATYCGGNLLSAEWVLAKYHTFPEGNYCYWPLGENYLGDPPALTQWIEINSEGEPEDEIEKKALAPKDIFIRIEKAVQR